MRKTFLGLAVIAAIATPLAFATSAQAANIQSTDTECTPVVEIFAAPAKTHIEYKWTPVKSNAGPTQWTLVDAKANEARTFDVKGATVNYFRDGTKTQTVIDTPAVQAVDGTTCVIPVPANPLDVTLTQPADGEKYTWSPITDHSLTTNKVGIVATAKPGYVFTYNGTTMASKNLTLTNVKQFSYVDVAFGNVTCHEIKFPTYEDVYCAFDAPRPTLLAPRARTRGPATTT